MTQAVQQLLATFDRLSREEQHVAAVEVLRRLPDSESALSDQALLEAANDLFEELDERENSNADG
jgi:hypothetical protein